MGRFQTVEDVMVLREREEEEEEEEEEGIRGSEYKRVKESCAVMYCRG